jgi:hypothetical protein
LVWENGFEKVPAHLREGLIISESNKNFGVWARFAYALNSEGEYICIFDDDTIPGSRWLENCLSTINSNPGLLGTRGIIFDSKLSYSMYREVGLHNPNERTEQVDIVGHCWFFKKVWLEKFWSEFGNKFPDCMAGEDIHFSYALQKHLNLPTLVPKHPESQLEFWGSLPKFANEFGQDQQSLSLKPKSYKKFEDALQHYRSLGFSTMSEKINTISKHPPIVYWFIQKFPYLFHKIVKLKNNLKFKKF